MIRIYAFSKAVHPQHQPIFINNLTSITQPFPFHFLPISSSTSFVVFTQLQYSKFKLIYNKLPKNTTVMPKQTDYDQTMKVLLIGNSGVGKSNLLMRFAVSISKYINLLNTIGVDFKVKFVQKNGQKIKVVLWDTAGQERFRTITNGYYRGADGILIVYDLTDRESFENVSNWYDEMNKSVNQKVVSVLIGNKLDMDSRRTVSTEEGRRLADKYNMPFAETSAKSGENVNQIFQSIVERSMNNSDKKSSLRPKLKPPQPLSQTKSSEEEFCTCCGN